MRDAPLVSTHTAGIPKPTHSSPPVPELISLSEVLPMMGIAVWCFWAAYTTTELSEVAASTTMSPEVAADAAEPHEVVVLTAVFPKAMVAAHAAEPPEAAVLPSAPCVMVVPSNALSVCHVTVEGTIAELSLYPDGTIVEPPEVAASAAEPLEVSVVPTYELRSCPVLAKEAICELSSCPVTVKEAICEPSVCPFTAMEAVYDPSFCPVTVKEAVCEPSVCLVTAMETVYDPSFCPVKAMEAACKLLSCSEPAIKANCELLPCPDPAEEAASELSALSVTPKDAVCELPDSLAGTTRAVQELPTYHCHANFKLTFGMPY